MDMQNMRVVHLLFLAGHPLAAFDVLQAEARFLPLVGSSPGVGQEVSGPAKRPF